MEELGKSRLASRSEVAVARDRMRELGTRETLERQRLDEMNRSAAEQISLNVEQVERLGEIVREQKTRKQSMRVLAGENGMLQNLGSQGINLELGQFVNAGTELGSRLAARQLKAVLRIPETQAPSVVIGQTARSTRETVIVQAA